MSRIAFYGNFSTKDDILTSIITGFQPKYLELVNGILQRHKNMATEEVYLRLFWCGGIVNAVIYRLSHGLKESPEEMAVISNKFLYNYNESTCIKDERFHG